MNLVIFNANYISLLFPYYIIKKAVVAIAYKVRQRKLSTRSFCSQSILVKNVNIRQYCFQEGCMIVINLITLFHSLI